MYSYINLSLTASLDSITLPAFPSYIKFWSHPVQVVFKSYGRGVGSSRDDWMYSFQKENLESNMRKLISNYNFEVIRYSQAEKKEKNKVDEFVNSDPEYIKWTDRLKDALQVSKKLEFDEYLIRNAIYRPFSKQFFYFDPLLCHRRYQQHLFFPNPQVEIENRVICVVNEAQIPFSSQVANCIPCLHYGGRQTQSFPFYTYSEDGNNRQENITDWALEQFQIHYQDPKITKWDIFHYTYALLHHSHYRDRYAANLKRELPRIPFAPKFHPFAISGKRLTEIHINYEQQPEYRLKHIENKDLPIDWRVEKMRLSKDKTQIKYNDFLTLTGIPPETFEYKLGNRSALDWIIDQYQVSTDKRSGITNDPNRLDDEEYIVRLIKQVITVSLETVKIVKGLPDLGLPKD
jgi:predicted helicase